MAHPAGGSVGITRSGWEGLHSEVDDLLGGGVEGRVERKQTHMSASPTQGYSLQEDLPNSTTFNNVMMLPPSFLNTADPCSGLFGQRLIAFLGEKTDPEI